MTLSVESWHFGYSEAFVMSDLIPNLKKKTLLSWVKIDTGLINIIISNKLNFLVSSWNHEQMGSFAKLT